MIEVKPLQKLSNAIVLQAAKDYRTALEKNDTHVIYECEHFFRSSWFFILTNVDGEFLIERLRKEVQG